MHNGVFWYYIPDIADQRRQEILIFFRNILGLFRKKSVVFSNLQSHLLPYLR